MSGKGGQECNDRKVPVEGTRYPARAPLVVQRIIQHSSGTVGKVIRSGYGWSDQCGSVSFYTLFNRTSVSQRGGLAEGGMRWRLERSEGKTTAINY